MIFSHCFSKSKNPVTVRPRSQDFCGSGRGGRGVRKAKVEQKDAFIDCLVGRLFRGAFRVNPMPKNRQDLKKYMPGAKVYETKVRS